MIVEEEFLLLHKCPHDNQNKESRNASLMLNPTQSIRRLIAFHLPQYHPIPENDVWWGRGFTEWTNVARARPQFSGHYQPHIPADLGFYDLRLPEARAAQAQLAAEYGIHGFCYYHYWFEGRRLLERPVNEILASGQPDFPFCLCWANEAWTRRWDGSARSPILMEQTYSMSDHERHIEWLIKAFADRRYIRIGNKPLFLIYRSAQIPELPRVVELWRERVRARLGCELYLCSVERDIASGYPPASLGLDAAVEFQPGGKNLGHALPRYFLFRRLLRRLGVKGLRVHFVFPYQKLVRTALAQKEPAYKRYRCITPMWDNNARRPKEALVFVNSTPKLYEYWLTTICRQFTPYSTEENLIFVNAWNEWAEGCHLEPCQRWGRAFLEATKRALEATSAKASP